MNIDQDNYAFIFWSESADIGVSYQIKLALDPQRLLNPDKVVRIEKPAPGEIHEW